MVIREGFEVMLASSLSLQTEHTYDGDKEKMKVSGYSTAGYDNVA